MNDPERKDIDRRSPSFGRFLRSGVWVLALVVMALGVQYALLGLLSPFGFTFSHVVIWSVVVGLAVLLGVGILQIRSHREGEVNVIGGVLAYLAAGVLGFALFWMVSIGLVYHHHYRRLFDRASSADVSAIRAWASDVIEAHTPGDRRSPILSPDRDDWPACIRSLYPNMVTVSIQTKTVHVIYGSGFGHWGMSIGPDGAGPPKAWPAEREPGRVVRRGVCVWVSD